MCRTTSPVWWYSRQLVRRNNMLLCLLLHCARCARCASSFACVGCALLARASFRRASAQPERIIIRERGREEQVEPSALQRPKSRAPCGLMQYLLSAGNLPPHCNINHTTALRSFTRCACIHFHLCGSHKCVRFGFYGGTEKRGGLSVCVCDGF